MEYIHNSNSLFFIYILVRLYDQEHGDDDDDDLENNTFLINLTTENIETAKINDENIILPSEYWDDEVNTSTTIPLEDQPWFDEVEINIDGVKINEIEKLTDKELTETDLVNGKITVSNLMNDSQNKDGITKDSTLIPKLTTVTNKRLTSSTVTVSDIINDSTSLGLSRTSTLILDPPVNYGVANIDNNGQYLPSDFNSSGNYDPTHSAGWDYIDQINVNVTNKPTIYYYRGSNNNETFFTDYGLISSLTYTNNFNYYGDDLSFYFGLNGTGRIQLTKELGSGTSSLGFYILMGNISFPDSNNKEVVLHLYDSSKNELFKLFLTKSTSGNNAILFGFNKYFNLSYKNNEWLGN